MSFAKAPNPFCNLVFGGRCGGGENMPQQMVNTGNRSHGNTADPDFYPGAIPLSLFLCRDHQDVWGLARRVDPRPLQDQGLGALGTGARERQVLGQERLFWTPLVDSALRCSGEWGRARAKPGPAAQLSAYACSPGGRERSVGCGSGV